MVSAVVDNGAMQISIYCRWPENCRMHRLMQLECSFLVPLGSACLSPLEWSYPSSALVLQMCGRAGRPPFDDTGTVLIMTRKETVNSLSLYLSQCIHVCIIQSDGFVCFYLAGSFVWESLKWMWNGGIPVCSLMLQSYSVICFIH